MLVFHVCVMLCNVLAITHILSAYSRLLLTPLGFGLVALATMDSFVSESCAVDGNFKLDKKSIPEEMPCEVKHVKAYERGA